MSECLRREFANPSSQHAPGRRARALVETARAQVAARVGAAPERIFFTSGATEANNLALLGMLAPRRGARRAPRDVADRAQVRARHGARARGAGRRRELRRRGRERPRRARARSRAPLRADTVLVSIMHVNNETGVVQDVAAIGALCRERGVRLHVDAAQSVGKLPLALGACADRPVLAHGAQGLRTEGRRRAVRRARRAARGADARRGAGARAARRHARDAPDRRAWARPTSSRTPSARVRGSPRCATRSGSACEAIPGVRRERRSAARRAPHLLNVTFPGVEGESLRLALRDLAVSAGSACAADSPEASHVLTGMGLSDTLAASSLRFSVGRFTTAAEVERAAERVAAEVARLRALAASAPAWCSA